MSDSIVVRQIGMNFTILHVGVTGFKHAVAYGISAAVHGQICKAVRPAIGIEFCIDPLPEFLSLRFTTGPEGIGLTQGA